MPSTEYGQERTFATRGQPREMMSEVRSIEGRQYELLFGSDVIRDGVFLELSELADGVRDVMAEAFFYDELGYVVFNAYRLEIPYPLLMWLYEAVLKEGWPLDATKP